MVGAVVAASAGSDVVIDVGGVSIQIGIVSFVVADSVGGRCDVVRVRIVIPGSVGAAGKSRPSGVSPAVVSGLAVGLATGVFFRDVGGIVSLPMI